MIKNPEEIEAMRQAGKLLGKMLAELRDFVEPGKSTLDIEYRAQELCKENGVKPAFKGYHGYPWYCCISTNNDVVHGFPNEKPLKKGDLVTIDFGIMAGKLHTDSAVSVIVGGEEAGSPTARRLNEVTRKAMYKGIREIKPGAKTGDIGNAIQKEVERAGFSIIKELTGHGIGYNLHEDPQILNYGKKGSGTALKPGMIICIEPIVSAGERFIETAEDGWTIAVRDGSLGCQWEHMVLVTPNGHEILTQA